MDIDETRLEGRTFVVRKLMDSAGASGGLPAIYPPESGATGCGFRGGRLSDWRYEPCTVTDFEVCKRHGWNRRSPMRAGAGRHYARAADHPASVADFARHDESARKATMLNYTSTRWR